MQNSAPKKISIWLFLIGVLLPFSLGSTLLIVAQSGASSFRLLDVVSLCLISFGMFLVAAKVFQEGLACLFVSGALSIAAVIDLIAFNFFRVTGSHLDFGVLMFGVSKLSNAYSVILSETPLWILGAILMTPLIGALPFAVIRFTKIEPWLVEYRPRFFWWGCASVLVGVLLTFVFPRSDAPANDRHPLFHIFTTGIEHLFSSDTPVNLRYSLLSHMNVIRSGGEHSPNVVFIMLESTRASATELHGGPEGVTPFLSVLGSKSLVAERAQTVVPHTSKALVAINCGFEPVLTMHILEADRGIPGKCLPHLLKPHGYHTKFIQSAQGSFENRQGLVRNMGFEEFSSLDDLDTKGFKPTNYFGVEDHVMIAPIQEWLSKKREGPFFLSILTISPHHQYLAPENMVPRHRHAEEDEFDRYLHSIKITDDFVRQLFELLKEEDHYENTVFVIVGDHGEGFGEHGRYQHDNVIYQEGIQVPLLFHDGRAPRAGRIKENVSQIDIVPTVLEMAGFKTIGADFPGESALGGSDPNRPIFSACWYERNCASVLKGNTKFIYHFGRQPNEVFDIKVDPLERTNIIETNSPEIELDELKIWWGSINAWYDDFYSKSLIEVVHDAPPDVSNRIGAVFPNGVTLVGANFEREDSLLYVELVFQNTVGVPTGTTTGIFADEEALQGGTPSTRKAWIKTSDWPQGKSVSREFVIEVEKGNPLFFSMSHQGVRLIPTGIDTIQNMVPLGLAP